MVYTWTEVADVMIQMMKIENSRKISEFDQDWGIEFIGPFCLSLIKLFAWAMPCRLKPLLLMILDLL